MVGRFIAGVAGIAGALAGSQAPGYTLQYMQNLNGRLDELRPLVRQFDADVARYGYNRAAALLECENADGLLDALCNTYVSAVERYEELNAHKIYLDSATGLQRPLFLARDYKRDIAENVLEEFEPAIPVTVDAAAYAGGAFAFLWGGLSFLFGLIGSMFGIRRYE